MPVTTSYPGVYIEEIPSGVRTITGVATSIAAFIGRAERGSVNVATVVNSLGEFERTFGGLQMYSPMAFAVRDFFVNGGARAVIVRLFKTGTVTGTTARVTVDVAGTDVFFDAASPGLWGRKLRATLDWNVSAASATAMGLATTDLFNVTVRDLATGATEVFRNLSLRDSARRVDRILAAESSLVRWANGAISLPLSSPQATPAAFTGQTATSVLNDDVTGGAAESTMGGDDGTFLTETGTATDNGAFLPTSGQINKIGLYALEQADQFNILVIPPYLDPADDVVSGDVNASLLDDAAAYCEARRAMLLVDSPRAWNSKTSAKSGVSGVGTNSKNAALYFPRVLAPNPLRSNRLEELVPSGAIAGIWSRTDTNRGVWKAPAGLEATLVGVPELEVVLTDAENGELNPLGVNCLRVMPASGRIVWGARTLQGDDRIASEWKYVPVRRTALYIEESLYRGTQWVVFEPNDEPLWAQIRLNVGAFMHGLFRQGAFQGQTPKDAYFVKCDKETTTQDDINKGIVNIVVGFAPLKPAEFVIVKLQQMAGQVAA
jgi:phage tail sheath protein FI